MSRASNRLVAAALAALAALSLLAGCAEKPLGTDSRQSPEFGAGAPGRKASEDVRRLAGVDEIPRPQDTEALYASLRRHYPAELRGSGRMGTVLVEVAVDEQGRVQTVVPVLRPSGAEGHVTHRAVRRRRIAGSDRVIEQPMESAGSDPSFGPAAEAALREVRFSPAVKDGKPVAFKFRMTVRFTPPRDAL